VKVVIHSNQCKPSYDGFLQLKFYFNLTVVFSHHHHRALEVQGKQRAQGSAKEAAKMNLCCVLCQSSGDKDDDTYPEESTVKDDAKAGTELNEGVSTDETSAIDASSAALKAASSKAAEEGRIASNTVTDHNAAATAALAGAHVAQQRSLAAQAGAEAAQHATAPGAADTFTGEGTAGAPGLVDTAEVKASLEAALSDVDTSAVDVAIVAAGADGSVAAASSAAAGAELISAALDGARAAQGENTAADAITVAVAALPAGTQAPEQAPEVSSSSQAAGTDGAAPGDSGASAAATTSEPAAAAASDAAAPASSEGSAGAFVEKLKSGVSLTKHNRRNSKSKTATITASPDLKELTVGSGTYALSQCYAVRRGDEVDASSGDTGTKTLMVRKKSWKEDSSDALRRSFSLVFEERTLDFTCDTVEQCDELIAGFKSVVAQQIAAANAATDAPVL
jgi:hypothetical protein